MSLILIAEIFILLFLVELLYFKIAIHFKIVDYPNHRSSHAMMTLRGGGIIFPICLLLYPFFFGPVYIYFLLGLASIAIISFIDDLISLSSIIRGGIHLVSVSLMCLQLGLLGLPFYWIVLALILVIGCVNAINFMDGINGITGTYALVTLCSLLYINTYLTEFIISSFLITSIISVVVFIFFNFRPKAKCFAGDVGSVSIAFIIMFFLLSLIIVTKNFNYLLLILLYGLDTVTTIIFRLVRKENILEAHRSHFYQYLANERKVPHLIVSASYMFLQLVINVIIILWMPSSLFSFIVFLGFSTIIFVIMRFSVEGPSRLLNHRL